MASGKTKQPLTKEQRIAKEERRLKSIFKALPKDVMSSVDGIIRRAAFMRVTLEDMERDLDENGFTELFSQSEKLEPYERERPVARLYNTMNKNYQSIVKQLSDQVPKPKIDPKVNSDGFEEFVSERDM
ncbi:hypothetical protein H4O14_02315 [Bacillus sp. PAMC26568]|nr:hypothetical protein H4O14_02315 [Bacillus sp. PAMC26568]